MQRFMAAMIVGGAVLCASLPVLAEEPAATADKLSEGWRKEVKVSEDGDTCTVWVEKGWLQVQRKTTAGELDWHFVLAQATDPTPPQIETLPLIGKVSVSYRGGRYFVRESLNYLRCLREAKSAEAKDWPRLSLSKDDYQSQGWAATGGTSVKKIHTWSGKSWFVITVGPSDDAFDGILRLNSLELQKSGYGTGANADFVRAFHGDTEVFDDGELLVSKRTTEEHAKAILAERANRAKLMTGPAPELDGKTWLNAPAPLTWADLRGKVVLLDFWGTWCGPCVEKLPHTQDLYQKFKDQGLVVIGVHTPQGAENLESFVKEHKLDFPVVVDSGKTAEQYAVSAFPSYFLVGREGKVIEIDPTDQQIEKAVKSLAPASVKEAEPPKIYDTEASGAQLIADALAKAAKDKKRVLLQFGANWCSWCRSLHQLFETDTSISEKIKSDFVVVMIDVDKNHNADITQKYGQPTRFGLPGLVVLEADGTQLNTKDTSELEEGNHHNPEKVLEFLKLWEPKK